MKKIFTLLVLSLAVVLSVSAQVSEDFETFAKYDEIVLDGWINYVEAGSVNCIASTYSNNVFAYFNPYSSGDNSNIMWLITPGVNLDESTTDSLKFELAYGYFSTNTSPLEIKYSTDFDGTENGIASATWNDITSLCTIPTEAEVTSTFTPFLSTAISLEEYSGTIYIAFVYTGSGSATTAVELDDVVVGFPHPESKISAFSVNNQLLSSDFDATNHTINVNVYPGTDVTALVPTIEVSEGATVTPASGAAVDFTNPVTFIVTSSDGESVTDWVVTVNVLSDTPTSIYDLQYVNDPATDDASPYVGEPVFTTGIVTYGTTGKGYVQTGTGEWNGIYVYCSGKTLTKGDSVLLYGTVSEYYYMTEFMPDSIITVSDRNSVSATKVLALTESVEGVLVEIDSLTILDKGSGDFYGVTADGDSIIIDNYIYSGLSLTLNANYNISGVVSSYKGTYSLCPRNENDTEKNNNTNVSNIAEIDLSVYPNPVSDVLFIKGANAEKVRIINIAGQLVKTAEIENNSVDVSELNNGVYLLSVDSKVTRFIKK